MDTITIIQHNILHWETRKFNLINTHLEINSHIILINSYGMKQHQYIKVPGYTTNQMNTTNELNEGSTLLIKSNIKHILDDNYITDFLDTSLETATRKINIATNYLPPRRPIIPFPDFHRLASENNPVYFLADLKAVTTQLSNNFYNQVGRHLNVFLTMVLLST